MSDRISVLVTGATGFIGIPLCNHLASLDVHVIAVGRLSSSLPRLDSRVHFIPTADIRLVSDWSTYLRLPSNISGSSPRYVDSIIHCAARAHILEDKNLDSDLLYRQTNYEVTALLSKHAAECGVKRFIFMSSIGVNGSVSKPDQPFTSFDSPYPDTSYALSKLDAENAIKHICMDSDMDYVIVRPPLVYGPHAKGNFPRLVKLVSSGLPIPLGAVSSLRSFIGIDNLVEFLTLCVTHPSAGGHTFLISDGRNLSISNFIRLLCSFIDSSSFVFSIPNWLLHFVFIVVCKQDDYLKLVSPLVIDDSLARDVLSWCPPHSIESCVRRAVK